jgi:hypothetical protein
MESCHKKGIAQIQGVEACQYRKSRATFSDMLLKKPRQTRRFHGRQLQNPAAQGDIISGPWANAIAAQLAGLV